MEQINQMMQDPAMQNTIQQARQIAGMIKSQRKEQRTQPAIQALSALSSQYGSAQDDTQRQTANQLASQARANYLQGGSSPLDLPQQYWGSDPTQGFQTSEGFQAPITGFEGMGRTNAITARRGAFADTMEKDKWNKSLENQDWYMPMKKQMMELQLADAMRPPSSGGGGGGGGGSMTQTDRFNNNLADAYDAVDAAISGGSNRDAIMAKINSQTAALVRAGVDPADVVAYLDGRIPTAPSPEQQEKAAADAEKYRLNSRPWGQQTVDYWLPGKQYR